MYEYEDLTTHKTEVCKPCLASDLTFLVLLCQPKTGLCEVRELIARSAENATLRGDGDLVCCSSYDTRSIVCEWISSENETASALCLGVQKPKSAERERERETTRTHSPTRPHLLHLLCACTSFFGLSAHPIVINTTTIIIIIIIDCLS